MGARNLCKNHRSRTLAQVDPEVGYVRQLKVGDEYDRDRAAQLRAPHQGLLKRAWLQRSVLLPCIHDRLLHGLHDLTDSCLRPSAAAQSAVLTLHQGSETPDDSKRMPERTQALL